MLIAAAGACRAGALYVGGDDLVDKIKGCEEHIRALREF